MRFLQFSDSIINLNRVIRITKAMPNDFITEYQLIMYTDYGHFVEEFESADTLITRFNQLYHYLRGL